MQGVGGAEEPPCWSGPLGTAWHLAGGCYVEEVVSAVAWGP